eukprot:Hpha_TRINITY_DN29665_c0_g1::TRINITY_DN29665_c0_g1_i1::g.165290::m.165290
MREGGVNMTCASILVVPLLLVTVVQSAPVVYWSSAPVRFNDTLLVAGAGFDGAKVAWCPNSTGSCHDAGDAAVTWEQSAQIVVPEGCVPPCRVTLTTDAGTADVVVNQPEIWWAIRSNPSGGPLSSVVPQLTRSVTVSPGQSFRVFGRALGWADDGSCISAATPLPAPRTKLVLPEQKPLGALSATCYEATFDVSELLPWISGTWNATLQTEWGSSEKFELTILPPAPAPAPPPPVIINVDSDCHGDVAAALARAAAAGATPLTPVIVQLGQRAYEVRETLVVPNYTWLSGKSGSHLAFKLPLPPAEPRLPLPAAVTVGSGVTLDSFALTIDHRTPVQVGRPPYVGVWMPANASHLVATRVNVTLSYPNVSNAFRIEGQGFQLSDSRLVQNASCGGSSDQDRSFMESVTLYLHGSREGLIARNYIGWKCSAFDLDVSERVIFEDNNITCLETGTVPHGNSLSAYDWTRTPWSRAWSVARNSFSRPPCNGPMGSGGQCGGPTGLDNWFQRETLTTDGSGGWAVGHLLTAEGATVHLNWTAWTTAPQAGCRLLVIDGPGVGQSRSIMSAPANGTLILEAPLDAHVRSDTSLLAVVNDVSDKLIVGNRFSWTEVVQAYGHTQRYVAADNVISHGNIRHTGGGPTGGIMGATAECYHGIGVVFFTEFVNNTLIESDGINLRDGGANYLACGGYTGPWIRWSVIRRNSLSGVSLASINTTLPGERTACSSVVLLTRADRQFNTTDVVAEHQAYDCPSQYAPGGTDLGETCGHCVER